MNGTWRYEFYGVTELPDSATRIKPHARRFEDLFNTIRPHQALKGQTPLQYLEANFPDPGPHPSHMSLNEHTSLPAVDQSASIRCLSARCDLFWGLGMGETLEQPRHLVVEGPIGVGKTSLTRMLADRLGARAIIEQPADNPFSANSTATASNTPSKPNCSS